MAIKKNELYSSLWDSCDKLRGGMDASQYKDYVLTLLFMKYVTDKFKGDRYGEITIPAGGSFDDLVKLKNDDNIGEKMDKVIGALMQANSQIGNINTAKFNDETKFGKGQEMKATLTDLISIFERPEFNFANNKAGGDDILGDAYEYLMRNFATESGKSKGQFYTPAEVSRVLAKIIGLGNAKKSARGEINIYDPACGSGSLLIRAADEVPFDIATYGQEKDVTTAGLAKMNMVIHNKTTAEIKAGSTFSNPQFLENGELKRFDFIVANPPFSLKNWMDGLKEYGRFDNYGDRPPEKNGDYAWLMHIIKSLKPTGKAAVILPHGVLFRGNAEETIRKTIIDQGYIKGIIGLPPNLFYGTGIPACIIVIDKEDKAERNGIFMIDASHDFVKDGNKNRLRERDIYKIVQTYVNRIEDDPKYARCVPMEEIKVQNGYNLNIPRYIHSGNGEDEQSIEAHLKGGIPAKDIDSLERYWKIFPALKGKLFKRLRADYFELKVEHDDIRNTVFEDEDFKKYFQKIETAYNAWKSKAGKKLLNINSDTNVRTLIVELAENLVEQFRDIELVDFYDVYQVLLAYWQEIMSDDVLVIKYDGYKAGTEIVKFLKQPKEAKEAKETKKAKKAKKDPEPKEIGWEGKLLPKSVIERAYFASQRTEIEAAEQLLAKKEAACEEFVEENNGEGSVFESYFKQGSEDLDTKKIGDDLKKRKVTGEEFDVLNAFNELASAIKAQKTKVTKLNNALDEAIKEKITRLSEKEIKTLIFENKWCNVLYEGIKNLYDSTSHKIATRVTELAERYENTLPDLETAAADYETKVKNHLKEMGFEV